MGRDEWLNAATEAFKQRVRNLIVTLGAAGRGMPVRTGGICSADPVDAVDTTAAGDAFNATLAFKLGKEGIRKAILWANAAGAITVPHWLISINADTDELEEFYHSAKNKESSIIDRYHNPLKFDNRRIILFKCMFSAAIIFSYFRKPLEIFTAQELSTLLPKKRYFVSV